MIRSGLRLFEALAQRALPGALNLLTLVFIGKWLGAESFGIYSTATATAIAIAALVFGPVFNGIVYRYAEMARADRGREYLSSLVGVSLILASAITALAVALTLATWDPLPLIAGGIIVTWGLHTVAQEAQRAQIQLWRYGVAATCQAIAFGALAWALVRSNGSVSIALTSFAVSYAIGAGTALLLGGLPLGIRWSWAPAKDIMSRGAAITFGTAGEQLMVLGIRYLLMSLGTPAALGILSYAFDVATRTVGFLVNAASFTFVPRAFTHLSFKNDALFRSTIRQGAFIAVVFSVMSTGAILVFSATGLLGEFIGPIFDPLVFLLVSIGVIVSRMIKLVLVPYAMKERRHADIALAFWISGVFAVALCWLGLIAEIPLSAEYSFLAGTAAIGLYLYYRLHVFTAVGGQFR